MSLEKLFFGILGMLLLSCTPDQEPSLAVCGIKNPLSEMAWLKDFTDKMQAGKFGDCSRCVMYVEQLESREVLIVDGFPDDCILCEIRECDGGYVKFKDTGSADNFISTVKKTKTLWRYKK